MKKQKKTLPTPTEEQFTALNGAYQYFNQQLFDGKLRGCILNFSRKNNTHGFMAPERWRRVDNQHDFIHEISLTPMTLYREPIEIFSTLVHEMCHLWQWDFSSPSRNGYHNKEWANKMEEIGLIPSDNGHPGGKKTGQQMTHYIETGGRYEQAFQQMPKEYLLPFTSFEGDIMRSLITGNPTTGAEGGTDKKKRLRHRSPNKTKYHCPGCNINVWGKPGLRLLCINCKEELEVVL